MSGLFDKDYTGEPFQLFGTAHLIALAVIALVNLSFVAVRQNPDPRLRQIIRYALVVALIVGELSWHIWNWSVGLWSIQKTLPLHLCSVFVVFSPIMLITKNYRIYEFAYFLGIGGASQAILTPDAGIYGFPHFRFFQVLLSHGAIVTAAIYMTIVEGYRPYWSSLVRVIAGLGIYALLIGIVNVLLGSNYLFIMHKPDIPSLIDMLGPWPLYLIPVAGIAVGIFILLYLPFAILDWRKGRKLIASKS